MWGDLLAKVVCVTVGLSAMLMMGLYAAFGFERIPGLGQVFWILLLGHLLIHLRQTEGVFADYLFVLSRDRYSLLFDIRDVWIYVSSKRTRHEIAVAR